jgi:peptide/nickel transport system permease protein
VVENVFAVNGIGQQLVQAILQRDFVVVQGIALIFGLIVVIISVGVEVIQAALDPRAVA